MHTQTHAQHPLQDLPWCVKLLVRIDISTKPGCQTHGGIGHTVEYFVKILIPHVSS